MSRKKTCRCSPRYVATGSSPPNNGKGRQRARHSWPDEAKREKNPSTCVCRGRSIRWQDVVGNRTSVARQRWVRNDTTRATTMKKANGSKSRPPHTRQRGKLKLMSPATQRVPFDKTFAVTRLRRRRFIDCQLNEFIQHRSDTRSRPALTRARSPHRTNQRGTL